MVTTFRILFFFFSPHTKILFVRVVFTFSIFHLVCHSDDIWDIWEVNAVQQIIVQVCRSVRKQNGSQELHSDLALVTFFSLFTYLSQHLPSTSAKSTGNLLAPLLTLSGPLPDYSLLTILVCWECESLLDFPCKFIAVFFYSPSGLLCLAVELISDKNIYVSLAEYAFHF